MAEPVIALEAAQDMLDAWVSEIGATLSPDSSQRILASIMAGRLDYSAGRFHYRLIEPVTTESGPAIDTMEIAEPNGAQLREASRGNRQEMDVALRLLSAVSKQPIIIFDRMRQRDILLLTELIAFFA